MTVARGRLVAVVLALAVLVGACGALSAVTDLIGRLQADGFSNVNVNASATTAEGDVVAVTSSGHSRLGPDAAPARAAEITWRTFPLHLDRIQVDVGGATLDADRSQLTSAFGPRDPGLDATSPGDEVRSGLVSTAIVVGVVLLVVVVGVIVLIVVLVRRSRRRRAAYPPGPPGPPGYPPGPAGPPGYPPDPPPGPPSPGPPPPPRAP